MANSENKEITNVETTETTAEPKKGFFGRFVDGTRKLVLKVKANPVGRAAIKVLKVGGVAAAVYGAYNKGQKSVAPTTVCIESDIPEETAPVEENQAEEADKEPVEETNE